MLMRNIIKPNEKEIISKRKVGNQRYIRNLFTQVSGINPKKNKSIGELVKQVDFAIVEECKLMKISTNAQDR